MARRAKQEGRWKNRIFTRLFGVAQSPQWLKDNHPFLSASPGTQLELLNLFLKPQVDQGMRRDASFLSSAANGLRQSFLDGIQRFLGLQVHIGSCGPGFAPIVGQIMLIPEIAYSSVRCGLGDTALPADTFPSTSRHCSRQATLGTGLSAITSSHTAFFQRRSCRVPSVLKYDDLVCG